MGSLSRLTPAARRCYDIIMPNRIHRIHVRDRSLDPAQAELWLIAETDHVTATTELHGRLMGPQCRYAATVEVAYPLRPLVRRPEGLSGPAARVVIPEPSLWDPQGPFVYQGTVELWQDGQRCDQIALRRGLRRILLGPHGLRVNGQPLALRGRAVTGCDEQEAAALRRAGFNLLLPPAAADLWGLADSCGFFILGRLREPDEETLLQAQRAADHPSCFGWLLEPPFERWQDQPIRRLRDSGAQLGVEFTEPPLADPPPEGIGFVACPVGAAAYGRILGLPLLLIGGGADAPDAFGGVE
jgi:hypothetical protein